ncbi:MAG: trypsin-like peptidase domain-containing protein [Myxococcota bacterium]
MTVALGTAAALALGSIAILPAVAGTDTTTALETPVPTVIPDASYNPTRSFAPLVDAVSPAVVAIEVEGTRAGPEMPPMMRRFFGQQGPNTRPMKGEGSGFVISADGLLLTNHHVVDGADTITVRFSDGRREKASLIGSDAENDVALLQLPKGKPWPHVTLGDSDALAVGDWVVAVGNPLGLGTTVTAGIISGKGRNLGDNPFHAFLQTDAAINQGNSGGPLFAVDGRVVGMNTAIIQYANTIGFAVPSGTLKRLVEDLQDDGLVQRGFIGVGLQPVDADLSLALGMETTHGALVNLVQPDQPGAKAGLAPGDVIVRVNDRNVRDVNETIRTIGALRPGDRVRLGVWRDGKAQTLKLTLGERPGQASAPSPREPSPEQQSTDPVLDLGIRLAPATRMDGVDNGVRVLMVEPGGPAAGKLRAGDVLLEANRVPIDAPSTLARVLTGSSDMVLLKVQRGQSKVFVAVPLGG